MKAQKEYYILKKTWNRNILHGPFPNTENFDDFITNFACGPEARGGPVRFYLLKVIKGARVRRGVGGRVGIERQADT